MTDAQLAQQNAKRLIDQYLPHMHPFIDHVAKKQAIKCALLCVQNILNANPHSNPFNTEGSSSFTYWLMVQEELKKM